MAHPGLDGRDVAFMERLRNLAREALTWEHLSDHQRLVWAAALELDVVPVQEMRAVGGGCSYGHRVRSCSFTVVLVLDYVTAQLALAAPLLIACLGHRSGTGHTFSLAMLSFSPKMKMNAEFQLCRVHLSSVASQELPPWFRERQNITRSPRGR